MAADPHGARLAAEPLRARALERFNGEVVAARAATALTRLGLLDAPDL